MPQSRLPWLLAALALAATPLPAVLVRPPLLPQGIAVPKAERATLTAEIADLKGRIERLEKLPAAPELLPDVEVLEKAADWALNDGEIYKAEQIGFAHEVLREGRARAEALANGRAPWARETGTVVRGYRSRLDGSVQPYVVIVPDGARGRTEGTVAWERRPYPLQVWLQGRDPERTELAFMAECRAKPPALVLPGHLVLRPYGRFCNAFKFAGEVDVLEALAAAKKAYAVDPARIALVGFSMGGAGVWHLATHHPGMWTVASAGAGFAETPEYTGALRPGQPPRQWWEPVLWKWYDATPYAANVFNLPLLAYNGEIDEQRQSSEVMEAAMKKEGLKLERFIGPKTEHRYEPETEKRLIARLMEFERAGSPRPEVEGHQVRLVTYFSRYGEAGGIRIEGLEREWARAEVRARRVGTDAVEITTRNVSGLSVDIPGIRRVRIDGRETESKPGRIIWKTSAGLRKHRGLAGPVDDAFMGPFLFVRPTGVAADAAVGRWAEAEMKHALKMWHDIFRGDAQVKDDTAVTAEDIAGKNLILWGDPGSNAVLGRMAGRLPLKFPSPGGRGPPDVPIFIYPNPLNPGHYVVVNSGIDFRGEAYGTNALQTPKLPDWVRVDITTPPDSRWPGRIVDGGFFDADWGWSGAAITAN